MREIRMNEYYIVKCENVYEKNRMKERDNLPSLAIIEMDSTVKGLRMSVEAQMSGEIELKMIRCNDPVYFVAVFKGKRDELLTVMDSVFDPNGHGFLKLTVLPSPEEEILDVISSGTKIDKIEQLGVVETAGFGVMVKCIDIALKESGVSVGNVSFDTHSGKGLFYLSGENSILRSLIEEMKGICGILNITDTAVINSPTKEMVAVLSRSSHERNILFKSENISKE